MKKVASFCLLLTSFTLSSAANAWFENNTPLSQAHQKLLENNLEGSFSAMIQVWQSDTDEYIQSHLNELLLKSLEPDCGKSLTTEPLSPWLNNIVIRRQSIQSPGRVMSKVIVESASSIDIESVRFLKWPANSVSNEIEFKTHVVNQTKHFQAHFALNKRLSPGLYQIELKNISGDIWNSWVVMGESKAKEVVRWDTKDSWAVDKFGLLNPYCALPVLGVSLYDYIDDEYVRVWNKEYETDYPSTFPLDIVAPDRYVLAVSITHKRRQGVITIEDQQVISKTYDISAE